MCCTRVWLRTLADISSVSSSLDRPVNVLAVPGVPPVSDLADAGVARISIGGGFSHAALRRSGVCGTRVAR